MILTAEEVAALPPDERFMCVKLAGSGLLPADIDAAPAGTFGAHNGFTIPYWRPDGTLHPHMRRVRLEHFPAGNKYTQPSTKLIVEGGGVVTDATHPYLNPYILGTMTWAELALVDRKRLLLVEGELKAACAGKWLKLPAIGLPGCEGGVVRDERHVAHVHPVLLSLLRPGDYVEVVLDGDIFTNRGVNKAAGTLKRALARLGIAAVFVLLPKLANGAVGLDDFLMSLPESARARAFDELPRTYGADFNECHISLADYFKLAVNKHGYAQPTLSNLQTLMEHHEHFDGLYFFDVLQQELYCNTASGPVAVKESETFALIVWLERFVGVTITKTHAQDCLRWITESPRWRRNPLIEALPAWDGKPRLETMFVHGWGEAESEYVKAVGRNWLTSAVARALDPGCKVDTMLVLVGPQGIGKSRSLEIIATHDYYVATHTQAHDKDFTMALHRGWMIDMAELSSMNHTDAAQIKGIITTSRDKIRPPYAAKLADMPRHSIVVGTTNEDRFLRDKSGNRRFWPIACGKIDIGWIEKNRLQLLAEAMVRYQAGEDWWTMPDETRLVQERRVEIGPHDETVAGILSNPHNMRIITIKGLNYRFITSGELLDAIGIEPRFRKPHHFSDLAATVKRVAGAWEPILCQQPIVLQGGGSLDNARGYGRPVTGNPKATVIELKPKFT